MQTLKKLFLGGAAALGVVSVYAQLTNDQPTRAGELPHKSTAAKAGKTAGGTKGLPGLPSVPYRFIMLPPGSVTSLQIDEHAAAGHEKARSPAAPAPAKNATIVKSSAAPKIETSGSKSSSTNIRSNEMVSREQSLPNHKVAENQRAPSKLEAGSTKPKPAKSDVPAARKKSVVAPTKLTHAKNPPAAPPAPRTKAQRLNDLLADYKANFITSIEYHEQRAKILAEP